MTQKTYQLPLTFEQILNLVLQLPAQEQEQLIQEIKKNLQKIKMKIYLVFLTESAEMLKPKD